METELDQMLADVFDDDAAEAADPDDSESAADAEPADGQDAAEAADEEPADAADADEPAAEAADADDPIAALRQQIEALQAERAAEQAQAQALARQQAAAREEAQLRQDEAGWMAYFDQLDEQAWQQAQQTYNPAEAYRIAVKQIEAARRGKQAEYANHRAGQYQAAYAASQLPYYAQYLNQFYELDGMEAAQLAELATTPGVNPDSLPRFAQTLKQLREARVQEQRAAKAASLKKSAVKPGGGAPHKPRPQTVDDYIDAVFG